MASPSVDELLAAIRHLPLEDRLRLIARATLEASDHEPLATTTPNGARPLLGLMADEPNVVDEMCAAVYEARRRADARG